MITITNRLPTKPNRWKITHESDSSEEYVVLEHADEPTTDGTPINKATLEGIQNDLMSNTELIVAEYTAEANVSSIEFTGLDFENDGSFYEIIFSGKSSSTSSASLRFQVNDITTGYSYKSSSANNPTTSSPYIQTGSINNEALHIISISKTNNVYAMLTNYVLNTSTLSYGSYIGFLSNSENITKLTFTPSAGNFVVGTNIKIIKRR